MVSCGLNERLKTVPLSALPPAFAVPYRVLPERTNPAAGKAPSLLIIMPDWAAIRPADRKLSAAMSAGRTNRFFVFILVLLLIATFKFFGGASVRANRPVS